MTASISARLRVFGAVSVLSLAASAAFAQTPTEPQGQGAPPAPAARGIPNETKPSENGGKAKAGAAETAPKTGDKAGPGEKAKVPVKPAAPAGYATEAEARAHWHGSVVWV